MTSDSFPLSLISVEKYVSADVTYSISVFLPRVVPRWGSQEISLGVVAH